jgi:hypothetical protein
VVSGASGAFGVCFKSTEMDDYDAAAASSERYLRGVLKTRRRSQVVDAITAIIGLAPLFVGGFALPLLGAVLMLYGLIELSIGCNGPCLAFKTISLISSMDAGKPK